MLAVKADYRNLDLGRSLKLAQREHVMAQGIGLISWTFDPLQSLNAYFNFSKLGVLADRYLPNFYGEDAASFLHQTGTDRLWVSWFVSSERVQRAISGSSEPFNSSSALPLIEVDVNDSPRRNDLSQGLAQEHSAIEIPSNIDALEQQNRETARRWREETRWAFTEALKAGYFVESFAREMRDNKRIGKYFLRKDTI
jgi:predicted GNAT superfamily acetyltransferase